MRIENAPVGSATMKSIRSFVFLLILTLQLVEGYLEAAESEKPVVISKTVLARLVGEEFEPVEAFTPSDNFGVLVFVSDGKPGTRVKANWIAVEAGGMKDKSIFEKEVVLTPEAIKANGDPSRIDFSLLHDNPYPTGLFKADFYLNDVLTETVQFKIEALTFTLDFCGTEKTENPTEADLRQSVAALDSEKNDAYLALGSSDMTYLQVSGDEKAGFVMEYQERDLKHHFQANRRDLTAAEVVKALVSYSTGTEEWKTSAEWSKVDVQ